MSKTPKSDKKCHVCKKSIRNNTEIKVIKPILNLETIKEDSDSDDMRTATPVSPTSSRSRSQMLIIKSDEDSSIIYKSKTMRMSKSAGSVLPINQLLKNSPMLCYECYNN